MNVTVLRCIAATAAVWIALAAMPARAATPVLIEGNGPSANRVDLVILGDGYKADQMAKFAKDARNFVASFFAEPPFRQYKSYFNVWRIDTPSSKSGASHNPNGVPGTTRYGAYYFCFRIERLLCVVPEKVEAVLQDSVSAARRDMVIVLVNDDKYGGSGGAYAVAATEEFSGEVAIHEFGHSFGHLDDEYAYDDGTCGRYTDPWGFNVTQSKTRNTIPWRHWIEAATPIPTPQPPAQDVVGDYRGAFYCLTGWYRPTYESKMRVNGAPFREVNSEQIVRRIYETVALLDGASPAGRKVTIPKTGQRTFAADVVDAALPNLKYAWRLGGKLISTARTAVVKGSDMTSARATLKLTVSDRTPMVRQDTDNLLIETRSWALTRGQ